MTVPPHILHALSDAGLEPADVIATVRAALAEDLAYGADVTTEAIFTKTSTMSARMVAREAGCLAGVPVAAAVPYLMVELIDAAEPSVQIERGDGQRVQPGDVVITLDAAARVVLTAERTMLNLASQLSGVASAVAAYVDAIAEVPGAKAKVRDTRKTIPGLRVLQKYAVRCGGGKNHRMGLGDAALIKDNHIAAVGSLERAVQSVRDYAPDIPLEVECDTLDQVREAVKLGVNLLLLDNMSPEAMTEAVRITSPAGVKTEASGGLTLDDAQVVAATGVDYISVGALTHSAPILDLALDV